MSSIVETGREFFEILGRFFALWVLNVLFGLVNGYLNIMGKPSLPPEVTFATLIVGFILAPSYAFHKLKQDGDGLRKDLHNRRTVIRILNELAELRGSGVAYRNRGITPVQGQALQGWRQEVDNWHANLRTKAEKVAEFERGLLATLNWIRPLYVPQPGQQTQVNKLNELNETLERLGRLLEAYRPIVWA
jgi:hypothetical protein